MAASINRVVLVGNLTRDPELRHTPSGTPVCSLRLAVNTRRKDESGQWTDKPNYFDITVWGQQGENCAQYLAKGRPVAVDGRLEWREWEAQDGSKRQAVEVVAESVQFLGGRQDSEAGIRARGRARCCRRWRRLPDLPGRRRHSVLGATDGTEETATSPPHRPGHRAGEAQELPLLPRQGGRDRLQEPRAAEALHLGEGEDPVAPDHGRLPPSPDPGRCRREARARDGPPSVRRLADEAHPPSGRREARSARRRRRRRPRLRAQLPAAAAAGRERDSGARRGAERVDAERAKHEARTAEQAQEIAERPRQDRAPVRGQVRPDRLALRLGDPVGRRRRDLARHARSESIGARSRPTRSSGSAGTPFRSSSSPTCRSR